jgi:hypothetical protein
VVHRYATLHEDADQYAHIDQHTYPHRHCYRNADPHADRYAHIDQHIYTHRHCCRNADQHAYTDQHINQYGDADPFTDAHPHCYFNPD